MIHKLSILKSLLSSVTIFFNLLGATLHMRQAATELLETVAQNPCDHIELDFVDVEYMCQSNEEIIKILHAVAKTQDKENSPNEIVPVYNYTNWNSLESFLLSV